MPCVIALFPLMTVFTYYHYINSESFVYPQRAGRKHEKFQNTLVEYVASDARLCPAENWWWTVISSMTTRYLEPMARATIQHPDQSGNVFQIRESQWVLNGTVVSVMVNDLKRNNGFSDAALAKITADVSHNA